MVKPIDWGGLLGPYLQPLKERLGMLPLGQYEDGSVRPAWPGMLTDALSRGMAAAETPIPPVNDDQAWADKSAAMFDAASLAPLGGLGVGALTGFADNAVGSAGAKLGQAASDLPMDLASRMARAKEMGFDTRAYHATGQDFDEFKPSPYRGASFFAMTPEDAIKGATAGANDMTGSGSSRMLEVMIPGEEIYGMALTPNEKTWWQALPETLTDDGYGSAIASALDTRPDNLSSSAKHMPWYWIYDEVQNPDGTFSYNKRPAPRLSWDEASKNNRDVYGQRFPNWGGEKSFAERVLGEGMSGFAHQDEAGLSIGIADPRRIRSVNAAFDPSKSDSANLLAANAPTGSLPGLATQTQEQDQNTLTTANLLRLLMGGNK